MVYVCKVVNPACCYQRMGFTCFLTYFATPILFSKNFALMNLIVFLGVVLGWSEMCWFPVSSNSAVSPASTAASSPVSDTVTAKSNAQPRPTTSSLLQAG